MIFINFVWEYYKQKGEMPDPIFSYIALGVLVVGLVAFAIHNHIQDKKKGRRY